MTRSLAEAAGRVLMVGYPAGAVPAEVAELARAGALAGVILFKRNLPDVHAALEATREYRALHAPHSLPLIAVDQEGGRVARLREPVLTLPPARELARRGPKAIRAAAKLLGQQLRVLGFNTDFAPVLDIDTNPDNPIIGDRSFGHTASGVIDAALPFADGLADAGVIACGKHFPGHGDTDTDSHLALPRLSHDLERLRHVELAPFAAAGRVPAIMTAHVVFDALDPGVPATLSRRVITDLLRGELGYEGAIISDDLEMKAIADHFGSGEAGVRAIDAGCDLLLVCSKVERALEVREALLERASGDAVFAERLLDAAARVDRLAQSAPPLQTTPREQLLEHLQRLGALDADLPT
ncbi:MAG: beta-N-acetylhexosaminidase [Myxococcales bacterium]|nr:beta-N-acetylhexosaminidase [Myxococcales bacterium]MCB9627744.1 beta-N-acetylhexosaminidase [Sandaracinaceae bacterium]